MHDWSDLAAVIATFSLPLAVALLSRGLGGRITRAGFVTNAGRNGFLATFAGAIAGSVGAGAFLAIYLFGVLSPVVAASVVGAYTIGLVICAVLAPRLGIWLPVSTVFIIRSAVQIGALGMIVAGALGIPANVAVLGSTLLLGVYLVAGGYRAAVETDIAQSVVIVAGVAFAAFGLTKLVGDPDPFLSMGPYAPTLLIGIWLFLPWSAVLSIDNWQRIALARSDSTARVAYLAAAGTCSLIFAIIALVGYRAPDGLDMSQAFRAAMPEGWAWVVTAMLVACIMSSVDTFVMPLASSLGARWSLNALRSLIVALLVAAALLAVTLGDVIANVIAAFSGLSVFLPVAFGALFLRTPPPRAAVLSMNVGLLATFAFALVSIEAAALVGFAFATGSYVYAQRRT